MNLTRRIDLGHDLHYFLTNFRFQDFPKLSGARVVRIATHADYQGMGYGSRALHLLEKYYEQNMIDLDERWLSLSITRKRVIQYLKNDFNILARNLMVPWQNFCHFSINQNKKNGTSNGFISFEKMISCFFCGSSSPALASGLRIVDDETVGTLKERTKGRKLRLLHRLSQRPAERLDYLGVSFGLTAPLLKFWKRAGYVPVYLRQTANDLTGEHSCIMLKVRTVLCAHCRHSGQRSKRSPCPK